MVDNLKNVLASVAEISTIKQATITRVVKNSSDKDNIGIEVSYEIRIQLLFCRFKVSFVLFVNC